VLCAELINEQAVAVLLQFTLRWQCTGQYLGAGNLSF